MTGKFDWIWHLGRDARLGYSDRYILTMTALKSANAKNLTFCIRQATIADNCAASERAVRRALAAGRRHGYIEVVRNRKRGRGNHGADEYRLTLPTNEIPATRASISEDKYRPPAPKIKATGAENTGQTRLADQQELPPPLGLKEVSRRFAADAAPPPFIAEPNRYCPEHMPWGTGDKCFRCRQARERREQWEAEKPARDREAAEAQRQARKHCQLCDEAGWLLDPREGVPVEPATPCPVCTPSAKDRTA